MDNQGQAGEDFKSNWNLAGGLAEHINELLREASDYYMKGDFHSAWKRLKAIYMRVVQLLSPEQEAELSKLCNIVCGYSLLYKKNPAKFGTKIASAYDTLNAKIMRVLHEKGLLLQGKKDASTMNF